MAITFMMWKMRQKMAKLSDGIHKHYQAVLLFGLGWCPSVGMFISNGHANRTTADIKQTCRATSMPATELHRQPHAAIGTK
eukprot:862814-Amphidinium_carterae.1